MTVFEYLKLYPVTDDRSFGRYIRILREEHKLTTRQLGAKIGCSAAYIVDVEKGNRPAPMPFIDKLCEALEIEDKDTIEFRDLMSASRGYKFEDIATYIGTKPVVRKAIRLAQSRQVPDRVWEDFISRLSQS